MAGTINLEVDGPGQIRDEHLGTPVENS